MTTRIEISDELKAYYDDPQTHAAVNFVTGSSKKSWADLAVNEFKDSGHADYKKYSDAWIYSKKVQKDYFDFMADLWQASWGQMISDHFKDLVTPTNFVDIEEVWDEGGWHRELHIKSPQPYEDLWLYCEEIQKQSHGIRFYMTLGRKGQYTLDDSQLPSKRWKLISEEGDEYFCRDCDLRFRGNAVEISDVQSVMQEAQKFLTKAAFSG